MTVAEKKARLEKWITKFPVIDSFVDKTDNVLKHTKDVDKLCISLVKDYYVCNRLSKKYGRKTSMFFARDNMLYKKDIRVESKDGKMVSIDTKYPTRNFSRRFDMWFEIEKNKKSTTDKLMYVGPNGYCWILDRERCLDILASKPTRVGKSGDILCDFKFDELARHEAIREASCLKGVFDEVERDLYV